MNTTAAINTIKIGDLIFNEGHYHIGMAAGVVVAFYPSESDPQVAIFELIHIPGAYSAATHYEPLSEDNIGEAFGQDEPIDAEPFFEGVEAHRYKSTLTPEQCDRLHELYLAAHCSQGAGS